METAASLAPKPTSGSALPFVRVLPFLLLRSTPVERLAGGREVSWLAALVILAIEIAHDAWFTEPLRHFSNGGFAPYFTDICLLGFFCYGLRAWKLITLPVSLVFSLVLEILSFIILPLNLVDDAASSDWMADHARLLPVLGIAALALFMFPVARLLIVLFPQHYWRALSALVFFGALTIAPAYFLEYAQDRFWYHDTAADEQGSSDVDDDEALFYSQDDLVDDALSHVVPETPGKTDLYYLGFGSDAAQGVFRKEVQFLQQLFDTTPDETHGVALIDDPTTVDSTPLAIHHNLDHALQGLAEKMNVDEDVLFLYLTSHGSSEHTLAIDFEPYRFADLTPEELKQSLDDAGIQWRVIVVSACYSGGFIDALKDDHTLIATAADADHTSFGCSNENDFTYYGEALLRDQLACGTPLLQAFPDAIAAIAAREKREHKTPSNPQLWISPLIAQHLQQYEAQKQTAQVSVVPR